MALGDILSIGRSSLLSHQAAIQVVSNNTANADVVGFSKRDVSFRSISNHSGVEISAIRRRADTWMTDRILLERSRFGMQSGPSQGLATIELELGDPDTGVGSALDSFFTAVRNLQPDPTSGQARADLISQAQILVETFNRSADQVQRERDQADNRMGLEAGTTNALLQDIADLNARITRTLADGQEPSHDLDERDRLIGDLAEQLPITTIDDGDGAITILLNGGTSLIQGGEASQLQTTADPALAGRLRLDVVDTSGLTTDITATLDNGRLGGLLQLRDGFLQDLEDRLDNLAFDLATNINTLHNAGFGLDGATGRDFFAAPAAVAGAALNLELDPALDRDTIAASTTAAGAVGENDNLIAIADLADQNLANGGRLTFGEDYAALVAYVGSTVENQQDAEIQAQITVDQLQSMKEAQTGVSIDEELIDITRFERAFQAASRIIQTVDEMFDSVLQL